MKTIFIFLVLSLTLPNISNAQFISNGGEVHALAGAIIAATTYTVVYSHTNNKKKAFWYSLGASTFAGIAKEVYDTSRIDNKFDVKDVASTIVGGLTASVTLSLFVGKKMRKNQNTSALVN